MRQNQQDNEHRNIIREQILRKGYAHQYDIRRFIGYRWWSYTSLKTPIENR